ncbi:alanyl-tRNA synthetase [Seinonella peptonophila]|uniref:Alanine--tRNA ligase n=1 Tax=Seinonella peptonophila TaxID=112248 RepID=A0A1M4WA13_9BACL|nr:alanine--tRNA ligase [Seinonella peptonophila]SHE78000.1 alanyl-tRNA synthetase [Seinonella peptonophila]
MKASEIRKKYLEFFKEKNHQIEPSASLVPVDDPSLLWINSGVATLKKYFDGRIIPDNPRIVNAQKSIRTNDIENVGYTARHHTFFEMLGNFSIGEYFKKEAITWAWEFLTSPKWIGFDPDRLSVTIYPDDEEAFQYWQEIAGLPRERIVKLKENFWDIGEGPCGPNTEIFYDRGEEFGDLTDPECYPGGENERFLEIWNLVFSQFNHNPDGSYTPLPKKNIDTGMGLERMASVLQNVTTNYDTDLFQPIIGQIAEQVGKAYGEDQERDIAFKVIADHIRTIVFAVGDGVLPSNEGRGYVLRRLLRRAVRYGRKLGMRRPFLYQLTEVVGKIMNDYYPEPLEKKEFIERVIRGEEERFLETLGEGLQILEQWVSDLQKSGGNEISGRDAFKLYDTYGFPFDLTEDFAREHQLSVDRVGFEQEMERQRTRAREARENIDSMKVQGGIFAELNLESRFCGYEKLTNETQIIAILFEDQRVDMLGAGNQGFVLLEETPFYAESGGQVGDHGYMISKQGAKLRVIEVQKGPHGEHIHTVVVEKGIVRQGEQVTAEVDTKLRQDIIKNHTATHLLHRALRDVLGDHVAQAGSLVEAKRLRFDFSHIGSMTAEELKEVERRVNEQIWENTKVETSIRSLSEARAMGAMALFGEKYGKEVRVVRIGDFSLELCGGTHVTATAEIGNFHIIHEGGIGSGIRRIEAVTGRYAYEYVHEQLSQLQEAAQLLKVKPGQSPLRRIDQLLLQVKELQQEKQELRNKVRQDVSKQLVDQRVEVSGVPVLSTPVDAQSSEELQQIMDELQAKITSGIIVLGMKDEGKVQFVATVSADYVKLGFHAGKLIKEVAQICGGGGGGRPNRAQAGGKNPEKLMTALQFVKEWVQKQVK